MLELFNWISFQISLYDRGLEISCRFSIITFEKKLIWINLMLLMIVALLKLAHCL